LHKGQLAEISLLPNVELKFKPAINNTPFQQYSNIYWGIKQNKGGIDMDKISKEVNKTIDSREVAEMLGKDHKYVLRDIEGTEKVVGIIPTLTSANLNPLEYFIKSTYVDTKGETRKCYQVTKMGCEMLGNKQQGEKGILFTAKYVKRFNDMENYIEEETQRILSPKEQLKLQLQILEEQDQKINEVTNKVEALEDNMPLFNIECKELQALVRRVGIKTLGGYKTSAYKDNSLRGRVYADIQHQLKREFGVTRYEAIKRNQLDKATEIITSYKAPTVLLDEIVQANNQMCFKEVM